MPGLIIENSFPEPIPEVSPSSGDSGLSVPTEPTAPEPTPSVDSAESAPISEAALPISE